MGKFSEKSREEIKNTIFVVLGSLVLSLGTAVFIIPFRLVAGGVSGTAIILSEIIGSELVFPDIIITALTWILFFVGLAFLGKKFAFKTLISSVVYPFGISFFSMLVQSRALGGILNLDMGLGGGAETIIAALFGGVLMGTGCALTFLGGGSTGGSDIIAFILTKHVKRLKSPTAIFLIDAVVIFFGLLVRRNLALSLLGIITSFIGAVVIDRVFLGESRAFIAQIISDSVGRISAEVIKKLGRTTTCVSAVGGFSGKEKKILLVSFTINQYTELMGIVNSADPGAFVTVYRAHEIKGEGWSK